MNPGSAPEWIGAAHFADEVDGVWGDGLTPDSKRPTFPSPEQVEAGSMPSDDRIGLNHPKGRPPRAPSLEEPGPKSSVQRCQVCSFGATAQDEQLVPQSQVLEEQVPARSQRRSGEAEDQSQPNNHAIEIRPIHPKWERFRLGWHYCQRQGGNAVFTASGGVRHGAGTSISRTS